MSVPATATRRSDWNGRAWNTWPIASSRSSRCASCSKRSSGERLIRKRANDQRDEWRRQFVEVERAIEKSQASFEKGDATLEQLGIERLKELKKQKADLEEKVAKVIPISSPPPHLYKPETIEGFMASIREVFLSGQHELTWSYLRILGLFIKCRGTGHHGCDRGDRPNGGRRWPAGSGAIRSGDVEHPRSGSHFRQWFAPFTMLDTRVHVAPRPAFTMAHMLKIGDTTEAWCARWDSAPPLNRPALLVTTPAIWPTLGARPIGSSRAKAGARSALVASFRPDDQQPAPLVAPSECWAC